MFPPDEGKSSTEQLITSATEEVLWGRGDLCRNLVSDGNTLGGLERLPRQFNSYLLTVRNNCTSEREDVQAKLGFFSVTENVHFKTQYM